MSQEHSWALLPQQLCRPTFADAPRPHAHAQTRSDNQHHTFKRKAWRGGGSCVRARCNCSS
eukprot:scaffold2119_cov19-Tisochrysis_lutea.AAC.4